MKHILDPRFRYTPSFDTDIRRTFDRIRRAQKEAEKLPPGVAKLPLPMKPKSGSSTGG